MESFNKRYLTENLKLQKVVLKINLKFYADLTGKYSNKYFCFGCESWEQATGILNSFVSKENNIRAVFLESTKPIYINGTNTDKYNVQITKKNNCFTIPQFYLFPDKTLIVLP